MSKVDSGRSISFQRNPDWWGKDLPVSRGLYNFDRFSIEYFGDTDVARQVPAAAPMTTTASSPPPPTPSVTTARP